MSKLSVLFEDEVLLEQDVAINTNKEKAYELTKIIVKSIEEYVDEFFVGESLEETIQATINNEKYSVDFSNGFVLNVN